MNVSDKTLLKVDHTGIVEGNSIDLYDWRCMSVFVFVVVKKL